MYDHCRAVFDEAHRLLSAGDARSARPLFHHLGTCAAAEDCPRSVHCTRALATTADDPAAHYLRQWALSFRPDDHRRVVGGSAG